MKKTKGNGVRSEKFKIVEVKADLFSCPDYISLAHCISQDVRMGKGIAVIFKVSFVPSNYDIGYIFCCFCSKLWSLLIVYKLIF